MEAELQCSNGIQSMERKLRIACHASDANIDNVLKITELDVYKTSAADMQGSTTRADGES
ncbi:unnamed protein product [Prunus armeniaca]|uniref:Uncharacterized protein n=1 Tax=Prunus armeniaca TaxID=36596 RepID=A0A6J5V3I6_PRUAR|nr:unnamed protein product [Prunus armeniaca]